MKIKEMAKKKKENVSNKKKAMTENLAQFSKTFDEGAFDKAMKLKAELVDEGESQIQLDKIKISTHDIYKTQFAFPEVAKNDFSTEVLEELEIAEKNLNSNMDNVDLFNTFVDTAEACKKKLKNKYLDQWNDPSAVSNAEKKSDDDDE